MLQTFVEFVFIKNCLKLKFEIRQQTVFGPLTRIFFGKIKGKYSTNRKE